jgi:hypothetical protein
VKRQAQLVGESDLFRTQDNSAVQSPAAGRPNSLRPSPAKKSATSAAPVDSGHEGHSISGIVDAILEVGVERQGILDQLRAALVSANNESALKLARKLCGLSDEESR